MGDKIESRRRLHFKMMKWLERERPEIYKEAMEHILKGLSKLKMEE